MTERRPPGVPVHDWVRHQIEQAERRGLFEDLPLTGKPIPGLDRERDPGDWLGGWVKRERIDVSALLPPSLALAKEVEDLPTRLSRERDERRVRELAADLDRRIRAAIARPQAGPPMRTRPLDVEAVVARWRQTAPPATVRPPAPATLPRIPAAPRGSTRGTVAFGLAALAVLAAVVLAGVLLS